MKESKYSLKQAVEECIRAITAPGTKQPDGTYIQRFGQAFVDMLEKTVKENKKVED